MTEYHCNGELNKLAKKVAVWADAKGFYPTDPHEEVNFGEKIALMHSELSEALEAHRNCIHVSEHVPEISAIAEEFADTIIRIIDTAAHMGIDIEQAVDLKMQFNDGRPRKHGKLY